jgi:hypothetical protein
MLQREPVLSSRLNPRKIVGDIPTVTVSPAVPGSIALRDAPAGLPDPTLQPPTIAESGDPFAGARIVHLIARLERGRPVRVDDMVEALNATYLDWLFDRRVVLDALLALQANWMADYRNSSGVVLEEGGPYGPVVTIEASSRVDPWIVRQVAREVAACRRALDEFSRLDRLSGDA